MYFPTVLVTRPAAQAQPICTRLATWGAKVLSIPSITIDPLDISPLATQIRQNIQPEDKVIFLSANAVMHSQYIWRAMNPAAYPYVIAIGTGTAEALTAISIPVTAIAPVASSEGLMELEILKNARGQHIYLCSGTPTRPWLAEQCAQHNTVIPVLCYCRKPTLLTPEQIHLLKYHAIDYVIATSGEIISHFYRWTQQINASHLLTVPLVVIHPKQHKLAATLGFQNILLAPNGETESLFNTISSHHML